MPFDTIVLNDGTNVRLFSSFPHALSYREPTVPGPRVRNRIQMEKNRELGFPGRPDRPIDDLTSA